MSNQSSNHLNIPISLKSKCRNSTDRIIYFKYALHGLGKIKFCVKSSERKNINQYPLIIELNGFKLRFDDQQYNFCSTKSQALLDLQIYHNFESEDRYQKFIEKFQFAEDDIQNFFCNLSIEKDEAIVGYIQIELKGSPIYDIVSTNPLFLPKKFKNGKIDHNHYYADLWQAIEDVKKDVWGSKIILADTENSSTQICKFSDEQYIYSDSLTNKLKNKKINKICIVGEKNLGKSTLNKYLINLFLNDFQSQHGIYYLDLDPGQSEFCPPSVLSLIQIKRPIFSPAFIRPFLEDEDYTIIATANIGTLSPENTKGYLDAVQYLYNRFEQEKEEKQTVLPLVMNTMGWIEGKGLTILSEIIKICEIDEITQLVKNNNQTSISEGRLCSDSFIGLIPIIHHLEVSDFKENATFSAKKSSAHAKIQRGKMLSSHIQQLNVKIALDLNQDDLIFNCQNSLVLAQDCLQILDKNLVCLFNQVNDETQTDEDHSKVVGEDIYSNSESNFSSDSELSSSNSISNSNAIRLVSIKNKFSDSFSTRYKYSYTNPTENYNRIRFKGLAFVKEIDIEKNRIILLVNETNKDKNFNFISKTNRGLDLSVEQLKFLNDDRNDFIEAFDQLTAAEGSDNFVRVKMPGKRANN